MSTKRMLFRDEAREKLLAGATRLADAVRVTLGPRSKSVIVERKWGRPLVCDDGVTIAKELELDDPEENLGVQLIREPAERTQAQVGDGTTTAMLLAHAVLAGGLRNVAAGASALDLRRGLDRATHVAVAALARQSRPVRTRQEKEQVATIAAHGDGAIGSLVADAVERVGSEGAITVEEAKGTETTVEVVEGMQFDRGYLSPYFVTDPDRMECRLDNVCVLLCDRRIASMSGLIGILETVVKSARPLLVVAEDVESEALATLVVNRMRGTLSCVAVKAPGFGDRRRAMLEDIAALVGAQLVSDDLGIKLESLEFGQLGTARQVVVTRDTTTLVGGGGDRERLQARIAQLRHEMTLATSDYDKEKLAERLARLAGGVAVVRAGAASEAELKNRKDAIDDAIHATRAAVAEGIVPGGGLAFLRAIPSVEEALTTAEGDERTGMQVLCHALELPARQIGENAGLDGGVVVDRLRAAQGDMGFDARRRRYVPLMDAGIVDATKVLRLALEHAVSAAGTMLLAEATLTELPKKPSEAAALPAP